MPVDTQVIITTLLALVVALAVAFITTPVVKGFARKVGAMDVPKDERRMHKVPIPRLGGLAIYLGFLLSVILFGDVNRELQGILLGATVIVILGVVDDIHPLPAWFKFIIQILAALIPVYFGVVIDTISNPNIFSAAPYIELGVWGIPVTVLWIVAITNSVNLIDGLDGLAVGVSTICSLTMLVISLMVSEPGVAVIMAALSGACIGFLPYNLNPAKIFMGDTGATFLGFILATVSVQGLFKFYAVVSFAVPFLILGLPIFDTVFAFGRRILKGKNPMHADRSHVHHRLIDMGMSQKQAVAILYVISAVLGLLAVVMTSSGEVKAMVFLFALFIGCVIVALAIYSKSGNHDKKAEEPVEDELREETLPGGEEPAENERREEDEAAAGGDAQDE